MEYVVVLTTVDGGNIAKELARDLVEKRLAACVQIIPIKSVYRWKRHVEEDTEYLCMIKTKKTLYEKVAGEIKKKHPYQVPEIIALPVVSGSREYLEWINNSVG